jgi:hypothetical protein
LKCTLGRWLQAKRRQHSNGGSLPAAAVMHIQALISTDVILPGSSSKLRLLVINLARPTGRQVQFRADCWLIAQLQKIQLVAGNVMRPHMIILAFIFLTSLKVTAQTCNANLPTGTINLRDLSFKKETLPTSIKNSSLYRH